MLKKVLSVVLGAAALLNTSLTLAAKPLFPFGQGISIEQQVPASGSQDFTNFLMYPMYGHCQLISNNDVNPVTFKMINNTGAIVEPGKDMDDAIWLSEGETLDMSVNNKDTFGVYAEGHATVNIQNHTNSVLRIICSPED